MCFASYLVVVFLFHSSGLTTKAIITRIPSCFLPTAPTNLRANGSEKYRNKNYNLASKCLLILRRVEQWWRRMRFEVDRDKVFSRFSTHTRAPKICFKAWKKHENAWASPGSFERKARAREEKAEQGKIGKFRKPQSNNLHTSSKCYLLISI